MKTQEESQLVWWAEVKLWGFAGKNSHFTEYGNDPLIGSRSNVEWRLYLLKFFSFLDGPRINLSLAKSYMAPCVTKRVGRMRRVLPRSPLFPSPLFSIGLRQWLSSKRVHLQYRKPGFDPWVWKILWRKKWQPTPVFLPGKSHGQGSLAGYSPWGHKELGTS